MAVTSFPFDSQDSTESQYSKLFRELQDTGVLDSIGGTGFKVTPHVSAMSLLVAPGIAYVRGHMVISTAQETIPLSPAGASTRFDRVVLKLDPAKDGISLTLKEGVAGSSAPTLEQTDTDVYEEALAQVEINPGVGVVAADKLTDQRRYSGQRTGAWTTAMRPASPRKYKLGFNETTSAWEYHNGSQWVNLIPAQVADSARWGGYRVVVSATTPSGTPDVDRIWIQPTA